MPPTFINDENLGSQPFGVGFVAVANLPRQSLGILSAQSDPGERVDGNTADVTCGNAYSRALNGSEQEEVSRTCRRSDRNGVTKFAMLGPHGLDDFAEKHRFACS